MQSIGGKTNGHFMTLPLLYKYFHGNVTHPGLLIEGIFGGDLTKSGNINSDRR